MNLIDRLSKSHKSRNDGACTYPEYEFKVAGTKAFLSRLQSL